MSENYSARISKRCREQFLTQTTEGRKALQVYHLGEYGCGLSELRSPYQISRHSPGTHALLFTLRGKGWLISGRSRQEISPGTVAVLPAGRDHTYSADSFWHLIWFHPSVCDYWNELMPSETMILPTLWLEQLRVLSKEFLQETSRRDHVAQTNILHGYANLIALFLRRELTLSERSGDSEHRHRLEGLWQQVSENPGQDWTVESLARASHFSRSHLQATVHRIYGRSAMEMVNQFRMEHAANLILSGHSKLNTIAEEVGYHSPFSFSRAFKRIMGVAPEGYRAAFRPTDSK